MGFPGFSKTLYIYLSIYAWLIEIPPQHWQKSLVVVVTRVLIACFSNMHYNMLINLCQVIQRCLLKRFIVYWCIGKYYYCNPLKTPYFLKRSGEMH